MYSLAVLNFVHVHAEEGIFLTADPVRRNNNQSIVNSNDPPFDTVYFTFFVPGTSSTTGSTYCSLLHGYGTCVLGLRSPT